ncbi:MSHA biogenesis protein MshK [Photobacterium nomapromontoriensis]|uniref:MSHA biogenesis protein MshK n=1 Tax=Photobacterium nomapromontoriensis TaxID=2910237 RepID=UPI003D0A9E1A
MVKSAMMTAPLMALMFVWAAKAPASQDPTAPLGWQAPVTQTRTAQVRLPQLQSTFCNAMGNDCRAILNDTTVRPGGRISGYTLVRIEDDEVILKRGSRQWRLEMFADNIKSE